MARQLTGHRWTTFANDETGEARQVNQGYIKKVKSPKVGGAAMGSKTGTGSAMKCIEVDESRVDMCVNKYIFFNDCNLCQAIGSGI